MVKIHDMALHVILNEQVIIKDIDKVTNKYLVQSVTNITKSPFWCYSTDLKIIASVFEESGKFPYIKDTKSIYDLVIDSIDKLEKKLCK